MDSMEELVRRRREIRWALQQFAARGVREELIEAEKQLTKEIEELEDKTNNE